MSKYFFLKSSLEKHLTKVSDLQLSPNGGLRSITCAHGRASSDHLFSGVCFVFECAVNAFRLECKRWRKKKSNIWGMGMRILMYVKYVLNHRLLQCFSLAGIFLVSYLNLNAWFKLGSVFYCIDLYICLLQCVNLVRLLVLSVQFAARRLRIGFLLSLLDSVLSLPEYWSGNLVLSLSSAFVLHISSQHESTMDVTLTWQENMFPFLQHMITEKLH